MDATVPRCSTSIQRTVRSSVSVHRSLEQLIQRLMIKVVGHHITRHGLR
jgi:ethanolamine utilization protein EutQ (cupin superfamily)